MVTLWKRLTSLDSNRITKKIFLWDKEKCENNLSSRLLEIFSEFGLESNFEYEISVDNTF